MILLFSVSSASAEVVHERVALLGCAQMGYKFTTIPRPFETSNRDVLPEVCEKFEAEFRDALENGYGVDVDLTISAKNPLYRFLGYTYVSGYANGKPVPPPAQ